ncbi:M20 metallopeptidase family protein [Brachyspira hampsonii]|uniref:Metal-dependent amidase/aminoacylase/carboxypeptidase n=3 Tax=Brachyspira hampsonii TaxID=1287055 RepID=A0A2U4FD92_9SPIR|nr:amidohydrolase [Brachyspira hampsonii]EKV57474.1 metal-dependent amidase/aminoacylase/carboxypeptidase [Brachyspira hampsonii 30446]MBW5389379.1 amidohydrolase [Brachyspira hampsonii]OEJ20188.1 peptidase M20 [Brachyspira hampsonii]
MEELDLIKNKIKSIKKELISIRRDIHSNPELSNEEFRTMELISEYLTFHNIKHTSKVAGTGIIADIDGIDKKFTVAFRADIDALPIEDLKYCDYVSKNKGVCHACGHDVHTAINMGIANIFSNSADNKEKIIPPCNVRLIFQPAEETTGGAFRMIKDNALENVNVIYGLHVSSNADIGYIQINDNIVNASCLDFIIKVYGRSSHGANPSGGVDAIVIASKIINDLQTVISRNIAAEDSAVITVGTINGGTATNIICDYVEMTGTIRALKESIMEKVKLRIKKMIKFVANSFDGDAEFIETVYFASLVNWKDASNIVRENASSLLGENKVLELSPSLGSEDFSFFVQNKPGAFFYLGARNEKKGIVYKAHNGLFDVDENCIEIGLMLQIMNLYKSYLEKDLFYIGKERN